MKSIELKIKSKHLSLEPAIIRCEEERLRRRIKYHNDRKEDSSSFVNKLWRLSSHRKFDVCNEARATFLARTFLEGKPYLYAERKRREDKEAMFQRDILPRILAMTKKYGTGNQQLATEKTIQEWSKLELVKA